MKSRTKNTGGLRAMWVGSLDQPVKAVYCAAVGLSNGALMVLTAAALGSVTDRIIEPVLRGERVTGATWFACLGAFVLISVLRWASIVFRGWVNGRMQHIAIARTRRDVAHRYLDLPIEWHRARTPGQLMAHAISDVDVMWAPIQMFFFCLGNVLMLFLSMVHLWNSSVIFGLVGAALVTSVLGLNIIYQRMLRPRTRDMQASRAKVFGLAQESVDGSEVVRSLGLGASEVARFDVAVRELRASATRTAGLSALFEPVLELLPQAAIVAVLAISPSLAAQGRLTSGELVGLVYLLLTVVNPLSSLSRWGAQLPISVVGGTRIWDVLHGCGLAARGRRTPRTGRPLSLVLRGVSLQRSEHMLLEDIDLQIEPGEVVAVVGAVGSGKSTLLEVVSGLLAPTSGEVLVDDVSVPDYARGTLTDAVGFVPQTGFLFSESIRDNLTLGREQSEQDLWRALEHAVAADFVRALPNGIDTVVGERGATLSGGQRQRIALARALLRRPGLLLLDDPTSALDTHVERDVLTNLAALAGSGRTTVVIVANRPGAIGLAQRIVLLSAGTIQAVGTADELATNLDFQRIATAYADDTARIDEQSAQVDELSAS